MEKTYYLIHIYFGEHGENTYTVYAYKKSRRFTARQAWYYIYHESKDIFAKGELPSTATIDDYWKIIKKLHLDEKVCDHLCTFGYIK